MKYLAAFCSSRNLAALAATCFLFLTASLVHGEEQEKASEAAKEPAVIKSHAFAVRGEPKYGPDFKHFDYVNPDAPKGGQIILSATGTFDSFNRYAQRGDAAFASDQLYDTLMTASDDEIDVYYALIAESLEYPEDYSWVIFHINPKARDHKGKPLTAEDVAFSFDKFMTEGVPQFRTFYRNVEGAEVLDSHRVRFNLKEPNREDVAGLTGLTILPKHYWKERNLSDPLTTPPVGSGAYRVHSHRMGQQVTYERLSDYWAMNIPSRKGTLNFDRVRYDYYRDTTVALEAFKAGQYDFRQEHVAKQWAEDYDVPALRRGHIVKEELPHEIPQRTQGFVFNTQHELFKDRRVRQALNLALDFEWMNRNLFYDQYARTYSYFENTPYKAQGKPSALELEILEPFKDQLPPEVFGEVWVPNVTDGSGNIRPALREAMALLTDAGWKLKNRKLVHAETGTPFEFELLIHTSSGERVGLPLQRNLERLGITMRLRQVDSTQFLNRLRSRDYAMIFQGYSAQAYPHTGMRIIWHSDFLDSTHNQAGVEDPVIDALIEAIVANQQNPEMLTALGHAFDRVARWNFYLIPHWHSRAFRVAYWNKFSRPEIRPDYSLGLETWWFDESKAKTLRR